MKRSKRAIGGLLFILLALQVGCAGLTHHKDTEALARVKRVAVVAFTVNEPAARELSLDLGSGGLRGDVGGSLITKNSPHVDAMYEALGKALAQQAKFQILPASQMKGNSGYTQAFARTMKGIQNKMPPPSGYFQYAVDGVMDFQSLRILGAEGRTRLMKQLGVDAVVGAEVRVTLEGTTVMGIGSRHPQARLSFHLFTANQDGPTWFEGGIEGEESKESVGSTAFIDEKLLARLSLQSAKTAFQKLNSKESL